MHALSVNNLIVRLAVATDDLAMEESGQVRKEGLDAGVLLLLLFVLILTVFAAVAAGGVS